MSDKLLAAAAALGGMNSSPTECPTHHVPTVEVRHGEQTEMVCAECTRLHKLSKGGSPMQTNSFQALFERELATTQRMVALTAQATLDKEREELAEVVGRREDPDPAEKQTVQQFVPVPNEVAERFAAAMDIERKAQQPPDPETPTWTEADLREVKAALEAGTVSRVQVNERALAQIDALTDLEDAECSTANTSTKEAPSEQAKSADSTRSSSTKSAAKKTPGKRAKKNARSKPNGNR